MARTRHEEDYFRQRERELAAQGRDSEDDDEWARPDYDDAREPDPFWENR